MSIVKERPRFGQVIHPKPGAVVASPVLAAYDPDPDYFFHWYRDAALVMDALRLLRGEVPQADALFQDYVRFSLDLAALDGRDVTPGWEDRATPDFRQFLRKNIALAYGEAIPAETRVNPDGTLDITDWPRPQHDGPALEALTLMRWGADGAAAELLRSNLAFVLQHARKPCFDIWEEEFGLHAYTLRVSAAALEEGAHGWSFAANWPKRKRCRVEAAVLDAMLDDFWMEEQAHIRSRRVEGGAPEKLLDIAVILASNHARVRSARYDATLARLEELFEQAYAINYNRPAGRAPALGRYAGDKYYSGGAYYFSTLGAAEFCYRNGEYRTGRCLSGNRARLHAGKRRSVRTIRPDQRRPDIRAPSGVELCRIL